MNQWGFNANNSNCFHLSGEIKEKTLIGGHLVDNLLVGGWHKVERKWGWVTCGRVMYKVLIGCGENVGFLPTNCPRILGPAKVKQHPPFLGGVTRCPSPNGGGRKEEAKRAPC